VKLNELMIQYPLAMHAGLFNAALAHVSLDLPIANEIVEKWILKWRRLSIRMAEQDQEQE
jgi:hypothetical protein